MQYAIYNQAGQFSRIEDVKPDKLPPIPKADDGLPRAVPVQAKPEHDPMTQRLVIQRDASWKVEDLPQEVIDAKAAAKVEADAKAAEIAAIKGGIETLNTIIGAPSLNDANQIAAIKFLAKVAKRIILDTYVR